MEPLFNLYGGEEAIATSPNISDAQIIAEKEAKKQELTEAIRATQILSPKDEPDADAYDFCKKKIDSICESYMNEASSEFKRVRMLMHENDEEFRCRALQYLYNNQCIPLLRIIEEHQLDNQQFLNCLGMVHHYEMPSEEEVNQVDATTTDSLPFYKKHPLITGGAILGLLLLLRKS